MDPISHGLLGASVGYLAFGNRLGRAAALAGGLAALAPDADIFIRSATDPLLAIEHHRGFSHSLLFAPVGAAVAAGVWTIRAKWRAQWLVLWQCALVAYISHCLLDAATSYGTQLFWPLSRQRVGWDLISIIDPLFTLTLAIGLAWSLRRRRRRPVSIALALGASYLGLGGLQHARATAAQEQLAAARGHRIERREIMPTLANNLVWRALYVADGQIHSDRIRAGWFSRPTVREGWSLPLVTAGMLTTAERERNGNHRSFQRFAWFSDHWVARSPADPTLLGDMRYTLSTEAFDPIWGIRFTPPGAPTEVVWINRSRERRIDGTELRDEILGRDRRFLPPPASNAAACAFASGLGALGYQPATRKGPRFRPHAERQIAPARIFVSLTTAFPRHYAQNETPPRPRSCSLRSSPGLRRRGGRDHVQHPHPTHPVRQLLCLPRSG